MKSEASFTLIELLVVIGVLGTLATAVVLVLNPAQLLAGARDSTRLSDLAALNNTLTFFQTDQYNLSMGTSSTVYVSVPDSSPVCANLGLPTLPSGWTYYCSNSTNYQKVDGSGWISINFTLLSSGSPLSKLPVDPVNTTSSGNYYTYTPGGSWELTAAFEAAKNRGVSNMAGNDGGKSYNSYEVGSNLTLTPLQVLDGGGRDSSLVGYWTFDEGSGGTTYDASGHGNTGTLTNGPTWQSGTNCKLSGCLSFDGANDYIGGYSSQQLNFTTENFTLVAWIKTSTSSDVVIMHKYYSGGAEAGWIFRMDGGSNAGKLELQVSAGLNGGSGRRNLLETTTSVNDGQWHHVVVSKETAISTKFYVDGTIRSDAGSNNTGNLSDTNDTFGIGKPVSCGCYGRYFIGLIDDVRVYNRALSAAEVSAIYNATR